VLWSIAVPGWWAQAFMVRFCCFFVYFTIFTHFHLGSLGPLVSGDNPKWKIVEALLPQVYEAERRERVADEQLPKIDQKDTLLALIAWCWEQKYDLTGVPKGAEELTSPDPDSAEKALPEEEEEPDESEDEPC
jgi:hypothetical protein